MSSDATKVVLVSGHAFGRRALEGIVSSAAAVVGSVECVLVAGLAETPSRVGAASFSDIADGHGIPFLAVTDPTLEAHVPVLAQYGPHYLLVIGWSRLIGPNALDLPRTLHGEPGAERNSPRHGCIGMHPTRLPEGRGQAPIPWTILKGLRTSALSTFFLDRDADAGPVISQLDFAVSTSDTASSLFLRIADLHFHAGALLAEKMRERRVESVAQDDAHATVWPRRRPSDSRLDFALPAEDLERFGRALSWPYPAPFVTVGDTDVRVTRIRNLGQGPVASPGQILELAEDGRLVIAAADGIVELVVCREDRALVRDRLSVGVVVS